MSKRMTYILILVTLVASVSAYYWHQARKSNTNERHTDTVVLEEYAVATFAGGCFWCTESDFEKVDGVEQAVSGYIGGSVDNPTYNQVSSGSTGRREASQVYYDPAVVSYAQLLDVYWTHVDPTDAGGQFADRGYQYGTEIFYHTDEQRKIAEQSKKELDESGQLDAPVITPITEAGQFYIAEDYHQDYYKKNPKRYKYYRKGSGRDDFLEKTWGYAEQIAALTPLQYKVTQKEGTERPFNNEYWDNHEEGIYVDIVSGEPLFSSLDKFDSGTGWPSFLRPIEADVVTERDDYKLFQKRVEIRSKQADSHLGHIIMDGPESNDFVRYCMNSASLRFIPKSNLQGTAYERFAPLFE